MIQLAQRKRMRGGPARRVRRRPRSRSLLRFKTLRPTLIAVALVLAVGAAGDSEIIPAQLRQTWDDIKRSVGLAGDDGRAQPGRSAHDRRLAEAPFAGIASVIDGDTIEIHGQRIRLHGIDAPESSQLCLDAAGQEWRCGQRAALALQNLIGRRPVTCDERDVDRYGRIISQCFVGEVDINEWLVERGLALAYRRYSRDYVVAEEEARAADRGIWAGTFEPPWEWRRRQG